MKSVFRLLSLGTLLAFTSGVSMAAGSVASGKQKAAVCFACHGADGNTSDSRYPRLAGQYDGYLVQALHEYQRGQRSSPVMKSLTTTLSEQDIEDIAAYFSSLPGKLGNLQGQISGGGK